MIRPPRARWFRFIASPRTAAWLIVATGILAFLGILIPQKSLLTADMMADFENSVPMLARFFDVLGLDALFSGWPVITLAGLLALSTIACTWVRIDRYVRGASAGVAPEVQRVLLSKADEPVRWESIVDRMHNGLTDAGWTTVEAPDRIVGVRGRRGFFGSLLLHVSLLIIMVGGSATALTDFSGSMVLAEGQSLVDESGSYLSVDNLPEIGDAFTGARLSMDAMRFSYQDGQLVEAIATMSGLDATARRVSAEARVNHPFSLAGKSYLVQNSGLVADITLSSGSSSDGLLVNLVEETPYGWADEIALPDAGSDPAAAVALSMIVSPVPLEEGETLPAESYLIDDPRLGIRVLTPDGVGELQVLSPGSSVEVAPDLVVSFNGVRYWTKFLVRQDYARWIVYLGFWLGVIGIVWRFAMPERRVSIGLSSTDSGHMYVKLGYRVRPWRGIVMPGDQVLLDRLASLAEAEGEQESEGS